ncbi:hypothetical protein CPU12_13060 [Malaciobacter molluscorum LMG 25693]|uniref:Gene product 88 domain-containing protein n=1 Tax=Malaciobacter molluscorum LMG 25693 TaxID=870501 RepID=A0A2G1DEM1_9BACT|nr:hypothetical protein [Malaciobacter molluscorum]AXX91166.1 hypothetical protein AMOL_0127 [Malaciobacter molluscorum LMG 25693]PHO16904.1 hypothetical protein CPU12_13060 [Malaciobacter molluscorum LMG 25693]
MEYNYDTTNLLSKKLSEHAITATLYLAAQKNIMHAPMYGIDYDNTKINLSKVNLCKKSTNGCVTACIYHNGLFQNSHFSKNKIKQARIKRTFKFLLQKDEFFEKLIKEIKALKRKAIKQNLKLLIQLNKTSDILWEKESFEYKEKTYKNIMEFFPDIDFFDYTKYNILKNRKNLPSNYTLIYSRAGLNKGKLIDSWEDLKNYLNKRISIAVVCSYDIKKILLNTDTYEDYNIYDATDFETGKISIKDKIEGVILLHEAKKGTNINKNSAFVIQSQEDISNYLV